MYHTLCRLLTSLSYYDIYNIFPYHAATRASATALDTTAKALALSTTLMLAVSCHVRGEAWKLVKGWEKRRAMESDKEVAGYERREGETTR